MAFVIGLVLGLAAGFVVARRYADLFPDLVKAKVKVVEGGG